MQDLCFLPVSPDSLPAAVGPHGLLRLAHQLAGRPLFSALLRIGMALGWRRFRTTDSYLQTILSPLAFDFRCSPVCSGGLLALLEYPMSNRLLRANRCGRTI